MAAMRVADSPRDEQGCMQGDGKSKPGRFPVRFRPVPVEFALLILPQDLKFFTAHTAIDDSIDLSGYGVDAKIISISAAILTARTSLPSGRHFSSQGLPHFSTCSKGSTVLLEVPCARADCDPPP